MIALWVKIHTTVASGDDQTITCRAINADTGVVLWVRQVENEFRIELEVAVGVDNNGEVVRHLPLLEICSTQADADEKIDDFLTAVNNGKNLFEIGLTQY